MKFKPITIKKLKESIRNGAVTQVGGYPLFYITKDGGSLCSKCTHKEFRLIASAIKSPCTDTQWEVIHCEINYEDISLYCDHCYEQIESAYGESD